jgi:hypothetical protein
MQNVGRRRAVALSLMGLAASPAFAQSGSDDRMTKAILDVEQRLKARLGVVLRGLESGKSWTHKADERFPMCSTFRRWQVLPSWPASIAARKISPGASSSRPPISSPIRR